MKKTTFKGMRALSKGELRQVSGGWLAWAALATYTLAWGWGEYCGRNYGAHPTLCFE